MAHLTPPFPDVTWRVTQAWNNWAAKLAGMCPGGCGYVVEACRCEDVWVDRDSGYATEERPEGQF